MKLKYASLVLVYVVLLCFVEIPLKNKDRLWRRSVAMASKLKLKGVCQSVSDNPSLPQSLINIRPLIGRHSGGDLSTNGSAGRRGCRPGQNKYLGLHVVNKQ